MITIEDIFSTAERAYMSSHLLQSGWKIWSSWEQEMSMVAAMSAWVIKHKPASAARLLLTETAHWTLRSCFSRYRPSRHNWVRLPLADRAGRAGLDFLSLSIGIDSVFTSARRSSIVSWPLSNIQYSLIIWLQSMASMSYVSLTTLLARNNLRNSSQKPKKKRQMKCYTVSEHPIF